MKADRYRIILAASLTIFLAFAATPAGTQAQKQAQKKDPTKSAGKKSGSKANTPLPERKVIERAAGAVEKLDFTGGPGGLNGAPKPPFTFIEEDLGGSTPKIKVKDANGVEWTAKFGEEVKGEVFSTRMI